MKRLGILLCVVLACALLTGAAWNTGEPLNGDGTADAAAREVSLVSSFRTAYGWSTEERKHNVELAVERVDGTVLGSEEVFSFNRIVGRRTAENGFAPAPIIVDGEFVEGVGGGVCQVSSTIYNAALLADMSVVFVRSHSLPVRYVLPSFDAMVSASCDLLFQNARSTPVTIRARADGTYIVVEFWGKPLGYTVERMSVTVREIPPQTEYSPAEGVESGSVIREGKSGYVSEGYLKYCFGGRVVKTVKIRRDIYYAQKRIIAS